MAANRTAVGRHAAGHPTGVTAPGQAPQPAARPVSVNPPASTAPNGAGLTTYTQPSAAPTRKVASGTLAGALVTVAVWVVQVTSDVAVPAEVAAAAVVLLGFATAWLVPDRVQAG